MDVSGDKRGVGPRATGHVDESSDIDLLIELILI